MAALDNEKNNPGLQKRIAEYNARAKKGRYVRVDRITSIFFEDGKDAKQAVDNFKKKTKLNISTL